jgi:hypothetical protein
MDNVWEKLYKTKAITMADADREYLETFIKSKKYKSLENNGEGVKKLHLNVAPLHFIGDIQNSRILVLSLNPGFSDEYIEFYEENKESYEQTIENNLSLRNPRFFEFDWYTKEKEGYWSRLKPLFKEEYEQALEIEGGIDDVLDKYFKRTIALVEFFPYHSQKYDDCYDKLGKNGKSKDYLPSQKFVFSEIKKRIDNKNDEVIIIITRSKSKWFEAIEGLKSYHQCYILSNPQNPSFEPENIMKCQFDKGKEIIEKIH